MSDTPTAPGILRVYQVLATILGINLLVVIAGFLGKILTEEGSWWNRHQDTFLIIDQVHGFLFMVLLVVILVLHNRYRWTPGFTISAMLLACVPLVTFWAERRTSHRAIADEAALARPDQR